jgi:protein gp37
VTESRARLFETIRATPWLDWLMLTKRPEHIGAMLPPGYWENVWLGTTAEDQEYADLRTPQLLEHRDRAPVLFLSVEPQIGPITFRWRPWMPLRGANHLDGLRHIDWVIVGGESGGKHRPFDVAWARNLREECREAGVAFHFKQHGGLHAGAGGCLIDGEEIKEFPQPRRLVAA